MGKPEDSRSGQWTTAKPEIPKHTEKGQNNEFMHNSFQGHLSAIIMKYIPRKQQSTTASAL